MRMSRKRMLRVFLGCRQGGGAAAKLRESPPPSHDHWNSLFILLS